MDEGGEVGFGGGGGPEAGGTAGGFADGLDGGGKGVAEDHGSPGTEEVEVAVAVFVVEVCSFGMGDEGWLAADGAEGADGRVNSAGEDGLGALLEEVGAVVGEGHPLEYRSLRAWV